MTRSWSNVAANLMTGFAVLVSSGWIVVVIAYSVLMNGLRALVLVPIALGIFGLSYLIGREFERRLK